MEISTTDLLKTVDNARLALQRMRERNLERIVDVRVKAAKRHNRSILAFGPFKACEDPQTIREELLAAGQCEDFDWIRLDAPLKKIEAACDRAMETHIRPDNTVLVRETDWWSLDVYRARGAIVKVWNYGESSKLDSFCAAQNDSQIDR